MMDLNEFAKEVHENAVAHGFWDEERPYAEVIALIHSEWSEALEEYRAGRPLVWHSCEAGLSNAYCPGHGVECFEKGICIDDKNCEFKHSKPEGIAVELIDGCIRILDLAARVGIEFNALKPIESLEQLPAFVCNLHYYIASLGNWISIGKTLIPGFKRDWEMWMGGAIYECFRFIRAQGLDPEAIMREKHEYNKTRPYKHGKVC